MDEFLVTRLSPGPVRDEILQVLKRHEHPYLVSKNINKLTYMNSVQDAAADPSENGMIFEQTIIQDSPVLDPKNLYVLPKIINNLDPRSFVRLARTCKEMNKFCFNTKEILIPCWNRSFYKSEVQVGFDKLGVDRRIVIDDIPPVKLTVTYDYYGRGFVYDFEGVKKLSKMPFEYHLKALYIYKPLDDNLMRQLRNFFSNFPRVLIRQVDFLYYSLFALGPSGWNRQNWHGLVTFMKDFGVGDLELGLITDVPYECLAMFTKNLSKFVYRGPIPDDVILETTAKMMRLVLARISVETFKELINKFAAGEITYWRIGHNSPPEGEAGSFIAAIMEVMKTVQVKTIDKTKMQPNVIYFAPAHPKRFYLLKSDGSMDFFEVHLHAVQFGRAR